MFVMCLQMLTRVFMGSGELNLIFLFNFLFLGSKKVEAFFDGYVCVEINYV